ncbi:UNVERIFIED_CONTAM: hypothetical protein Scaly_2375700 [Sesamum calycinum]|uniref:DDE Tnp4 domain-containing protein n=1 Tax=Sesamum calycinum TaxID=2727403 RepID=A0AAW2M216_9LAMI
MRRAWRLLNDLSQGTGWGWDHERNTITDESGRLEELCGCSQGTATGGIARSSAHPPPGFQTASLGDDEQMTGGNSGSRRSREDYEDTTFSQSQPMSTLTGTFLNTPTQSFTSPSSSKRPTRRGVSELHSKKCETMDKLNESLQGKIDRTGQKATESIERCVDELTKFKDLPDCVFTTALERFHSHSTRTIFLRLDDENKLRWLYSLGKTMASASEGAADETNSSSGTPGTPGTPGSTESDVPEEFYAFRDLICPELFREKVPRNTSALQVDALTSRGLLPHGQTSRVSSIEEVALFMQTVGMHKRQRDSMERFQHSLETINRRFHRVLSALCAIAPELITRPNFTDTHSRVVSNIDFYPYFKDCVGAMDGTLVPAWVPQIDQNRYRSRKGRLAQNVLAICDFDMNFTYVYAGWEGSAADARVLNHVVSQDPKFRFLQLDLFNHAHSRLRNVIERCFGVLKKRFPILQWGMPSYLLQHQVDLVIACCTLHNFIRHPTVTEMPQHLRHSDANVGILQSNAWHIVDTWSDLDFAGDHWTLSVEQRLMWMIVDDNTRDSMRDDHRAEAHMAHWARGLRRHFGYHYTREQFHEITQIQGIYYDIETFCMDFPNELRPHTLRLYPLARRYYQYPEPHYPSMLEIWGPIRLPPIPVEGQSDARHSQNSNVVRSYARGGEEAPIMISNSTTPTAQTHTHIGSWDAVQQVAHGDGAHD